MFVCEPPCFWQSGQTDRLGCATAISSAWLPERFSLVPASSLLSSLQPSLLRVTRPARRGLFFLHLPYLTTCTGGPSAQIKSARCSVAVPSVRDGSPVQLSPLILKTPHCPLVAGRSVAKKSCPGKNHQNHQTCLSFSPLLHVSCQDVSRLRVFHLEGAVCVHSERTRRACTAGGSCQRELFHALKLHKQVKQWKYHRVGS